MKLPSVLLVFSLSLAATSVVAQAPPPPAPPAPAEPAEDEGDGRIVGGHEARAGAVPWQVEIYSTNQFTDAEVLADNARSFTDPNRRHLDVIKDNWERDHRCGGALIARDWVVTAGHCVDDANVPGGVIAKRRVRLGSQSLLPGTGGTTYRIERAVLHAGYDTRTLTNDIALIHIVPDRDTARIDPRRAVPIRPPGAKDRPIAPDDGVSATGWGAVSAKQAGGPAALAADGRTVMRLSPTLKELNLTVREAAVCSGAGMAAYGPAMATGRALCVEAQPGEGDCNGDSGGPLVRPEGGGKFLLVGLVSQGRGCASGKPSVYTDVGKFGKWMADAMRTSEAGKLVRR